MSESSVIQAWGADALNTADDSQNEIHGDRIAREYGFEGGLVPGVTISAYLIHSAIVTWGIKWLHRGHAHVRVASPLYDGEQFKVVIRAQSESQYQAELLRPDHTVSATAEVTLPERAPEAPQRRGDPIAEPHFIGPESSPDVWAALRENGCYAFRYHWGGKDDAELHSYLRDQRQLPDLLQPRSDGYANMSFLLGCSNWILASNAHMNPWVHLETRSQNFRDVPPNTSVVTEMRVLDFYNRKGHEFVDVDVALFDEDSDNCLMTTTLRAIYRLRQ